MKIVRYRHEGEIGYGLLEGQRVVPLSQSPFLYAPDPVRGRSLPLADVRLLAPVESPRIIGAGFNYVEHIKETGWDTPPLPMLFVKPESSLIGPGEPIVYPKTATNVHYEAELVVVMGVTARRVSEQDALKYVLGYTCGNDVSDRSIQAIEMKFGCLLAGKGFETFAPMGPCIATDLDPSNLTITGRLNGEVRQNSNTKDLLFSVPRLIAYLSSFMTLRPGDMIMTGTPSGVGQIKPGDRFDVEISGIGILSNPVIGE